MLEPLVKQFCFLNYYSLVLAYPRVNCLLVRLAASSFLVGRDGELGRTKIRKIPAWSSVILSHDCSRTRLLGPASGTRLEIFAWFIKKGKSRTNVFITDRN